MVSGALAGGHLGFRVGAHRFSLPTAAVARVAELDALRRLPALPPVICGIASHRGRVLTVVDLAALLDRARDADRRSTRTVVIVHHPSRHVGLWVDAVEALREAGEPIDAVSGEVPHEVPGDAGAPGARAVAPREAATEELDLGYLLERLDACVREG